MLSFNQIVGFINHQHLGRNQSMSWGFFGYVLTKERQHLRLLLLVSCCHAYPENENIIHFKSIKSNFFIIVLSRKIQFTTPERSCPREIIVFTYSFCFTVCMRNKREISGCKRSTVQIAHQNSFRRGHCYPRLYIPIIIISFILVVVIQVWISLASIYSKSLLIHLRFFVFFVNKFTSVSLDNLKLS